MLWIKKSSANVLHVVILQAVIESSNKKNLQQTVKSGIFICIVNFLRFYLFIFVLNLPSLSLDGYINFK